MAMIRLPSRALGRLDDFIQAMAREDAKLQRFRDSRVYAAGYAVIETWGLLFQLPDPGDPKAVREAVEAAVDRRIDAAEYSGGNAVLVSTEQLLDLLTTAAVIGFGEHDKAQTRGDLGEEVRRGLRKELRQLGIGRN